MINICNNFFFNKRKNKGHINAVAYVNSSKQMKVTPRRFVCWPPLATVARPSAMHIAHTNIYTSLVFFSNDC